MDVIRRNTDYALRAAVELAAGYESGPVPAGKLASKCKIPPQLACKLLQRLHRAGIVKSEMGPEGGFVIGRKPSKITVRQIIEAVQGQVLLSRCMISKRFCRLSAACPVNPRLKNLQETINSFLGGLTLEKLSKRNGRKRRPR